MAKGLTDQEILAANPANLTAYQRRILSGLKRFPGASRSQIRGHAAKGESSITSFTAKGKLPEAKAKIFPSGTIKRQSEPLATVSFSYTRKQRKIVRVLGSDGLKLKYTEFRFNIEGYNKEQVLRVMNWFVYTERPRLFKDESKARSGQIILSGLSERTGKNAIYPSNAAGDLKSWFRQFERVWNRAMNSQSDVFTPKILLIIVRQEL